MKNFLATLSALVVGYLAIDMLAFIAWALSGQHPVDNFYIGSVTAYILRAILRV